MITIEGVATVDENGTLTMPLPSGIAPGQHSVTVILQDSHAGEAEPTAEPPSVGSSGSLGLAALPFEWDPRFGTFRREEMYGEDGR